MNGLRVVALAGLVFACSRTGPPSAALTAESSPVSDAGSADASSIVNPVASEEPAPKTTCEAEAGVSLYSFPASPREGATVRFLAVSDKPLTGALRVGETVTSEDRRGGPPYFWLVETTAAGASMHATFTQRACETGAAASLDVKVAPAGRAPPPAPPAQGAWSARNGWTHAFENLYSAWIEILFDAPESEQPTWAALHEVLRDPKRNILFDHLGTEDSSKAAPVIRPDCADLPYFLRAYFAYKFKLPFGLAECSRGGGGAPPFCRGLVTNEDSEAQIRGDGFSTLGAFLRVTVANKVHSGSARAPFEDENADYYPTALAWENLRPGTVYADPYGHVLVVAKRIPQTAERGGLIYAVDGQPDGTVARKRYWRGNFLYANQRELGGPGFKHFRPLARQRGRLARLDDESIKKSADYGDLSRDPGKLDREAFYDKMDDVLSPKPLDPERAMMETIDALEEQVRTRVQSVDNGRKWLEKNGGNPATMPDGAAIFETNGAWEDFATPSRDLRLLIAIDVVRGFPARVARRPERFAMPANDTPAAVEARLAKVLERELAKRSVMYTRTDGSSFTLTLTEVLARSDAFEMTYNLNDCVEARWGATPGTPEYATCRTHAPAEQKARMERFRPWFHDRRRPPRK